MSNIWNPEEEERLVQKYEEIAKAQKNLSDLENYFDRSMGAIERKIRRLREEGRVNYYDEYSPNVKREKDRIKIEGEGYDKLQSLLEGSDIDMAEWEVEKFKRWEVAQKGGGKKPLWSIQAKRNSEQRLDKALEEILQDVEAKSPEVSEIDYSPGGNYMLELSTFDLHIGKLAWAKETGEDYDLEIAERVFKKSVLDTLGKVDQERFPLEKIIWVLGQDYFNIDDMDNTTTAGTPQDVDSRWQKMFSKGFDLARWVIDTASEIAPVEVITCPGNHDSHFSYFLAEVLDAWYRNNENVYVDNRPTPRKYILYGINMIGFAHGKDERMRDLPMIAASEAPEMWGKAKVREIHLGHWHHRKKRPAVPQEEIEGVVVRVLPALTAKDAWHTKKGYVGSFRGSESFLWGRDTGLEAIIYASV